MTGAGCREPLDVELAEELCRRIDRMLTQLRLTRRLLLEAVAPDKPRARGSESAA